MKITLRRERCSKIQNFSSLKLYPCLPMIYCNKHHLQPSMLSRLIIWEKLRVDYTGTAQELSIYVPTWFSLVFIHIPTSSWVLLVIYSISYHDTFNWNATVFSLMCLPTQCKIINVFQNKKTLTFCNHFKLFLTSKVLLSFVILFQLFSWVSCKGWDCRTCAM